MANQSTSQVNSLISTDPQVPNMAKKIQAYQNYIPHVNPLTLRLDRNNFQFWSSQVLSTTRAHGLEDFLFRSVPTPTQFLTSTDSNGSATRIQNPEYVLWLCHDQFLLSWLFASISEIMLCESMSQICRCLVDAWPNISDNLKGKGSSTTPLTLDDEERKYEHR